MIRDCPDYAYGFTMALFTGLLGSALLVPRCGAAERLPDATEVTRRLMERSQAVARAQEGPLYTYGKRSVLERLNDTGKVLKSEERLYEVRLIAGFPYSRLVQIKGRELTNDELKKEAEKEKRFQRKYTTVDLKQKAARKEGWVTASLLERYRFTVKERLVLNQRPTLVLTFAPKGEKLPERNLMEKVLNRLSGTVWVDEADAETVRLSVSLSESISLGLFGILGSLSRCELSLERQRMAEGVWIVAGQNLLIHCRKLASTQRFRLTEEGSGFKKAVTNE